MKKENEATLVEIFAGKSIDAEIVKSILEDEGIHAYLKDENIGNIFPFQAAAGGVGAVKIFISSDDYKKGKEVVDEYYRNIQED